MWICWVARTVAHSLWSISQLLKCLSGAIKFEYRIRPDWQDIVLLMATGFTDRDSVRLRLPTASIFVYIDRISGSQYVIGCYYGKLLVCWLYFMLWYLCQTGMWNWQQQGRFMPPSSPSVHTDTRQRQNQHHEPLSVMMGCMILLRVFAFLISGGWWLVLVVWVRLRQQDTRVPSKNSEGLVLG